MRLREFYLHCHRLNEGFTVFLERKVIGRMSGEKMRQFDYVGKGLLCG